MKFAGAKTHPHTCAGARGPRRGGYHLPPRVRVLVGVRVASPDLDVVSARVCDFESGIRTVALVAVSGMNVCTGIARSQGSHSKSVW